MLRSTVKMLALLASFSFVAACGGGDEGPACDDPAAEMRGSAVIMTACLSCHSANSTNRQNAPANVNFDTPADIDTHEARIRIRAIGDQTMPPAASGTLSAAQVSDLETFLDCR